MVPRVAVAHAGVGPAGVGQSHSLAHPVATEARVCTHTMMAVAAVAAVAVLELPQTRPLCPLPLWPQAATLWAAAATRDRAGTATHIMSFVAPRTRYITHLLCLVLAQGRLWARHTQPTRPSLQAGVAPGQAQVRVQRHRVAVLSTTVSTACRPGQALWISRPLQAAPRATLAAVQVAAPHRRTPASAGARRASASDPLASCLCSGLIRLAVAWYVDQALWVAPLRGEVPCRVTGRSRNSTRRGSSTMTAGWRQS